MVIYYNNNSIVCSQKGDVVHETLPAIPGRKYPPYDFYIIVDEIEPETEGKLSKVFSDTGEGAELELNDGKKVKVKIHGKGKNKV